MRRGGEEGEEEEGEEEEGEEEGEEDGEEEEGEGGGARGLQHTAGRTVLGLLGRQLSGPQPQRCGIKAAPFGSSPLARALPPAGLGLRPPTPTALLLLSTLPEAHPLLVAVPAASLQLLPSGSLLSFPGA